MSLAGFIGVRPPGAVVTGEPVLLVLPVACLCHSDVLTYVRIN
jgi:hypothetical protein